MLDQAVGHTYSAVEALAPSQRMHLVARQPDEVPRILAKAEQAGGTIVKPATRTHWGIAGYFKDPDGHLFEVDFETTWVFDPQHHLVVDRINS
ncbi:VOC family protein [Duganella callida]|uniref:Glyoxalase/fosfomycin resistance/dioxygenase domain-containing protein n=1 Tax=Duganella callida TaxID=2561932 RepID=A0A4Y9SHM6_9BURK|nr:VOC family protein [Duganella callida]TFW24662.1 hypothetical protein E4L98_10110 [Duganella callida]